MLIVAHLGASKTRGAKRAQIAGLLLSGHPKKELQFTEILIQTGPAWGYLQTSKNKLAHSRTLACLRLCRTRDRSRSLVSGQRAIVPASDVRPFWVCSYWHLQFSRLARCNLTSCMRPAALGVNGNQPCGSKSPKVGPIIRTSGSKVGNFYTLGRAGVPGHLHEMDTHYMPHTSTRPNRTYPARKKHYDSYQRSWTSHPVY